VTAGPEITVVVASHARALRLRWLLNALEEQTLERGRWELVVVHDNAGEETETLLHTHPLACDGTLRHHRLEPGTGSPSRQRNHGWRDARAPIVAFTDDDCRPDPRWLEEMLAVAAAAPGALVQGRTRPEPHESAILVAPRRPGTAGILAGLSALFRPEIGAAAALGAALAAARATRAAEGTSAVRRGVNVAVAALVVAVLGWLPFALAAPDELLDQTIGFLGIQGQQRLPFPLDPGDAGADPNKLLERYLPLLLGAGLALWLVRRSALALAPLAAAGLLYLLGRTDEFHLVPLAAVLPVMLVASAARERLLPLRVAAVVVVALIAIHGVERKAGQLVHAPALAEVPGPAGDGVRADAREVRDLRRVLRVVRGKTIFVAPPRFSQVTVGNPLLYVLAGRENPTRYDVMQPGVVTTAKTQREMVRDLRRRRPDVLVRWLDPRTAPEDNESGRARGERILDRYLSRAYGRPQRFGVFAVSERR